MATIELTPEQQRALDVKGEKRVIDPRTKAEYFLVSAERIARLQEVEEDERLQEAVARTAMKSAVQAIKDDE